MTSSEEVDIAEDVGNVVKKHRQLGVEDKKAIFFAVGTTMVKSRPNPKTVKQLAKHLGVICRTVSSHWNKMNESLQGLSNDQPEDRHQEIISQNHVSLFKVNHAARKKGKFKYDRGDCTLSNQR